MRKSPALILLSVISACGSAPFSPDAPAHEFGFSNDALETIRRNISFMVAAALCWFIAYCAFVLVERWLYVLLAGFAGCLIAWVVLQLVMPMVDERLRSTTLTLSDEGVIKRVADQREVMMWPDVAGVQMICDATDHMLGVQVRDRNGRVLTVSGLAELDQAKALLRRRLAPTVPIESVRVGLDWLNPIVTSTVLIVATLFLAPVSFRLALPLGSAALILIGFVWLILRHIKAAQPHVNWFDIVLSSLLVGMGVVGFMLISWPHTP